MKLIIVAGSLLLTGCLGLGQPVNQKERFDNHEKRITFLETGHDIDTVPAPLEEESRGSKILDWAMTAGLSLLIGGVRKI